MGEKHYSIHNIVTFRLIGNISGRLAGEYENFESTRVESPDIIVHLGDFSPRKEGCRLLDNRYFVKEDYFFCEDSNKLGRWKIELSGFETGKIVVSMHTNIIGTILADMFVCTTIVDPLIRYLLNVKGYSAIHASAINRDTQAYLFPAQGGVGKTSTVSYSLDEGFDLLGDDYSILHNGDVFSYLTPWNLFAYNLNPITRRNLNYLDRAVLKLKNWLYLSTLGSVKIFSKLNPEEVFSTCERSKLKVIFFLTQGEGFTKRRIDKSELISRLVTNLEHESVFFHRYVMEYTYGFPDSFLKDLWKIYRVNYAKNILDDIPIYQIEMPRRYGKDHFNFILKEINSLP
jgi:hypothetical protein